MSVELKEAEAWAEKIRGATGHGGSVKKKAPNPGFGGSTWDDSSVTFRPRADLWINGRLLGADSFRSGKSGNVTIDAGQKGKLTLHVHIEAFEDNIVDNEEYSQQFSVTWDVSADKTGKLTIGIPDPDTDAPEGDSWMKLGSINPDQDERNGVVQVSPIVLGRLDTGNIIVKGGESAHPHIQETFKVNIKVNVPKVPKAPDPKGTVEIGNVVTAIGKYSYEYGPFVVGKAVPEKGNVRDWVNELLFEVLPDETQHEMRNGVLPGGEKIELWGYASNTGSKEKNDELSTKRLEAVIKEFKFFYKDVSSIITSQIARGERDVPDGKEKEDPNWRKVVVKIHHARQHVNL